MDTKWKKSKKVTGAVCYVLGVSLLLFCLICNPSFAYRTERTDLPAVADAEGRYEQTLSFRQEVSWMLDSLIRVGAGQPLNNTVYQDVGYDSFLWNMGISSDSAMEYAEITAVEEADDGTWTVTPRGEGYAAYTWEIQQTPEEISRSHDAFLEDHMPDKNILYELKGTDGEGNPVTYSNTDGQVIGGDQNMLPEQYDFLLKYDGEKARAYLQGQELDLYGDGIYQGNEGQWCVPGYENYKVPEDWRNCEITLAVRKVPITYIVGNTVYGNNLRRAYQDFQDRKTFFVIWVTGIVLTIAALLAALFLRKPRKEAGRQIGRALGKVPFEISAVLLCLLGVLCARLAWQSWWEWIYAAFYLYAAIVIGFWGICLFYLDLRYGNKPWKNSFCFRMISARRKKELGMDIQSRLIAMACDPLFFLFGGVIMLLAALADEEYIGLGIAGILLAAAAALFAAMLGMMIRNFFRFRKLAVDLGCLNEQIDAAYNGVMREAYELPADSDLADMAKKVAGIQEGLEKAVEERMKSERMKVELVANVSHDIKTPLTSIISYVDLLKEDESLPEELKDYVAILAQKSERLKAMVQDVFEVSKAASGQLPVQMEKLDLAKLLRQTMADMQEQIDAAPVSVKAQIPKEAVEIMADGQRLYRVFQNLLQNALQYSLEGSRIYVNLEKQETVAVASVRNTSRDELNGGVDFTERFVRGDASRTDGGSGLGLSIAKSFTEACKGSFKVETIADLFVVTVAFDIE